MITRVAPKYVVALLLVFATTSAAADKKLQKLMATGIKCYEQLNYGCAIQKLNSAAARHQTKSVQLSEEVTVQLYETLAFALASVERHVEAQAAFESCFRVRPVYTLDPGIISPKIYKDYKVARAKSLKAMLKGDLMAPMPMSVLAPLPPQAPDMVLHESVLSVSRQRASSNQLDLMAGPSILFGDDAQKYDTGFGLGMHYEFSAQPWLGLGIGIWFHQHAYLGDDLKSGQSGTLLLLEPVVSARFHHTFAAVFDLGLGLIAGANVMGVGTVGDRTGGLLAAALNFTYQPVPQFGVGLLCRPGLVIATSDSGDQKQSLTLPLLIQVTMKL